MAEIEFYNIGVDETCILCGEIANKPDHEFKTRCDVCGKYARAALICNGNHAICENCVNIPTEIFIQNACLQYEGTDPMVLLVDIMNSPKVRMHGPEHHYIVPATLLTCVANYEGKRDELEEKLQQLVLRVRDESPSSCTFRAGVCGAAIGTGIFLSMYLGRDASIDDEWSQTNKIVADSLSNVLDTPGPRCCKRDSYLSVIASANFLRDRFAIDLPLSVGKCTFSARNKSCGHEECNFYSITNSLV